MLHSFSSELQHFCSLFANDLGNVNIQLVHDMPAAHVDPSLCRPTPARAYRDSEARDWVTGTMQVMQLRHGIHLRNKSFTAYSAKTYETTSLCRRYVSKSSAEDLEVFRQRRKTDWKRRQGVRVSELLEMTGLNLP